MTPHDPATSRIRRLVYLKTLSVLLGYIALTWIIHRLYMHKHVPDPELSLALSFTLQQVIAILTLLAISFAAKFVRHYRGRQVARFHPLIREKLTLHLTGSDQWTFLRRARKRHLRELEDCLVEILVSVNGTGTERLADVGQQFGLVQRWQDQCRSRNRRRRRRAVSRLCLLGSTAQRDLLQALHDPDSQVKVEAARALARSGEPPMLAQVFNMALDQNLLVRAILTEALRPRARELYHSAVAHALVSNSPKRTVAALEMLRAWGRSAVIPELPHMLTHPTPAVRAAALRLIPQAGIAPECERQIWHALEDADPEVRATAAEVCGKLRLSSALLLLKHSMQDAVAATTLASAHALAELGPKGCTLLESEVVSGDPQRAAVALEALERVKLNRMVTVGM
jgi:HEAT repeat protein